MEALAQLDMMNDREIVEYLQTRGWKANVVVGFANAARFVVWSPWTEAKEAVA